MHTNIILSSLALNCFLFCFWSVLTSVETPKKTKFYLTKFILEKTKLVQNGAICALMLGQGANLVLANIISFYGESLTSSLELAYLTGFNFVFGLLIGILMHGFAPLKNSVIPKVEVNSLGERVIIGLVALIKLVLLLLKPVVVFARLYINIFVGHLLFDVCDQLLGSYGFIPKTVLMLIKLLTMSIQTAIFYYFNCDIMNSLTSK